VSLFSAESEEEEEEDDVLILRVVSAFGCSVCVAGAFVGTLSLSKQRSQTLTGSIKLNSGIGEFFEQHELQRDRPQFLQ
jgi:alkylhydroperoxidase family enzyme